MRLCKFCYKLMLSEHETKSKNSYFEFNVCPNCHAVYECTTRIVRKGREKYEVHENEKWWNPKIDDWEG